MFAVSDFVQMTGFKKEINLYLNGRFGRIRSMCPVVVQMYEGDHTTIEKELVVSLDCIHRCVRCAQCNRIHLENAQCSCAPVPEAEERQKRQKGLNLEELRVYSQSFKDGLIQAEQYDRALQHLCPGTSDDWVVIYKAGFIDDDRFVSECSKLVKSGEINLLTFTKLWLQLDRENLSFLHEIIEFFPDKKVFYCTLLKALIENGETELKALDMVFPLFGDDVAHQLYFIQSLKTVLSDENMEAYQEKIFDILGKMDGPCVEVLSQIKRFRNESKITAKHYDFMVMKWFGRLQTAHDRLSVARQFMEGQQNERIVAGVLEQIEELGPCKEFLAEGLITEVHYESVVSKWLEKVEGPALSALKQGKGMVAEGLITDGHYQNMVKKWLPYCV
jgi:hypothetical protein